MNINILVLKDSYGEDPHVHQRLLSLSQNMKEQDRNYLFTISTAKLFDFIYVLKENSIQFQTDFKSEGAGKNVF